MTVAEGNVGVAIGLVFGAGAATSIGASVVFFPQLVKRASRRVLASSLGLSAGVMIYVSFVEIFFKSVAGFAEDANIDDDRAYIYATLSFFGGVLLMLIVDVCVRHLSHDHAPRRRDIEEDIQIVWNQDEGRCEMNGESEVEIISPHCVGCSHDPVRELEEWHEKAELELQANTQNTSVEDKEKVTENEDEEVSGESPRGIDHGDDEEEGTAGNAQKEVSPQNDNFDDQPRYEEENLETVVVVVENIPRNPEEDGFFRAPTRPNLNPKDEKKKLVKMGLSTALAIFLHNFPEGLATFVAALEDPSVGAVLAIAIGLHNIPEGLCVALPIYYATGNRWKAFMWGTLSGIAEPIAALLGWLVLANAMSDEVYAILFGLVGGMMVMISMKELIPTAHRYDPEDTVVTHSIIVGMAVIGLSLVLFKL